ncbi:MAG: hypothetical protein FD143_1100 [Ignavibacteria bacterium]|nr:MAG: hypothetical protein FD143_1100 [Ignavibacteria bacterium]KAF0161031.1 MAG: hypothetical protein FD188_1252 [Ignavibacteria bacterium]
MKRRDFLKSGLLAGASVTLPGVYGNMLAQTSSTTPPAFDLVAIKGGEPDVMFDEAIKHLGGIKKFVKKNQKVLVKPNIGWDVVPERGANTHPKLVSRVVKHCFDAGAKEVYVFDHTCDDWKRSYANSGIEKAVKDAGGTMVPGNSESMYQEVSINFGKSLTKTKVHELILDSDVFINIPILKHHASTKLTICMKNLMGVVWDRGYWHRNNLHQCIADYCTYTHKPLLNVVDAYYVMKQNGPRGVSAADISLMKSQIISTDMVAADAAAAKTFGLEPSDVSYIKIADSMKIGNMNLSKLNIKRIIL